MPLFKSLFPKRSKSLGVARQEIEILRKSPLLDPVWYRSTYADLRDAPIDVARHYLDRGTREGRNPSRFFDTNFYLREYPDVGISGLNPLVHYILHGAAEGRKPIEEIAVPPAPSNGQDTESEPVTPAIDAMPRLELLQEFAPHPHPEYVSEPPPDPLEEATKGLASHFDAAFYLDTYPDVAAANLEALPHYCANGWKEGRDPTPWFSTNFYLKSNRDVVDAGINPFWHYITVGRSEGRQPSEKINPRIQLLENISPPKKTLPDASTVASDRVAETELIDILRPLVGGSNGLVISFSHTLYTEETAGTELFIGDEQHLFNAKGFIYLHFSPLAWSRFMIDSSPEETVNWIIVNGKKIGAAASSALARALIASDCTRIQSRIVVMHSPLGQSRAGFLRILAATNPTAAYYWLHDFSSLCTGYNLLRNNVAFCSAPPQNSIACTVCVFGASRPEHTTLLRETFESANFVVVAPSDVAKDVWSRACTYPHRSIIVKEHCRIDYSKKLYRNAKSVALVGTREHPIKAAFIGFGAVHKGWPTFERLVDETRDDPIYEYYQFVKKGLAARSRRIRVVDAVVTTADRDAMSELLSRHEIDIVVAPAIWPETFSYVTFEALAAGCDVVTIADSGNIAARVEETGRGRVFQTEDELIDFFTSHRAIDLVRSRAKNPNPRGQMQHIGTTAAIVFDAGG